MNKSLTLLLLESIVKKEDIVFDKVGRPHLQTPYSGRAKVILRAQKYNSTIIVTHVSDIRSIMRQEPTRNQPGLFIMSDGGPDFNPTSVLNLLYYYRLFMELDLDILNAFTYAARYSVYNCVEHLWAPLSKTLSGVVFSNIAPGDNKNPIHISKLTSSEVEEKEKIVFDRAMKSIENGHWRDASFNGFEIDAETVPCKEDDLLSEDYDEVKDFLKCPIRDIHKYAALREEFLDMFRHLDRHRNEIVIVKCDDRSCCKPFRSPDVLNYLKSSDMKLQAPVLDNRFRGHYVTFFSQLSSSDAEKRFGDDGQPSVAAKKLGKCDFCPNDGFSSVTEKASRVAMFHRRKKVTNKNKRSFACTVDNCGKVFARYASLSRHRTAAKHRRTENPVGSKRKSIARKSEKKESKRNKRSFKNVLARVRFSSESSDENDAIEDVEVDENAEMEEHIQIIG